MQNTLAINIQLPVTHRFGSRTSLWPALLVALVLHSAILLIPMARETLEQTHSAAHIELQLKTKSPPQVLPETQIPENQLEAESIPGVLTGKTSEAVVEPQQILVAQAPATPVAPDRTPIPNQRDFDSMDEQEKSLLTQQILSRQFITEESAADRLFGKPLNSAPTPPQKDFQYPVRDNLVTMLDKPVQDLPFEYTPGLIYFAYSPGVMGDMHRFLDKISPEFGWTTRYGTQVKCKLLLVIVGCAWK